MGHLERKRSRHKPTSHNNSMPDNFTLIPHSDKIYDDNSNPKEVK